MINRVALAAAGTLAVLLTGCGKEVVASQGQGPASGTGSSGTSTSPATGSGGGAAEVDVCGLVTAAEVKQTLGAAVTGEGGARGLDSGGECTWTNDTDPLSYRSLTVSVGGTNTAAGDTLEPASDLGNPEPVTGLGGNARYEKLTGTVEFAGGQRFCSVQVVDLATPAAGKANALKLAGLVRGRV
jgi:hypothetical protein